MSHLGPTSRMPLLFIGHGSPMNALADNHFTRMLGKLGRELPRPRAILMISAHWMTEGSWILGMDQPRTIHDFYGFPDALSGIQYSASGSPETAKLVGSILPAAKIDCSNWGFDHGTWSVLKHLYPKANIPTIQLSIDVNKNPDSHFDLGQQLTALRDQGVLIIGSGNIVHNLRHLSWDEDAKPFDWALEFDAWVKTKLETRDFTALNKDFHKRLDGRMSIPTLDHYLPLQYILGASLEDDDLTFAFDEIQNGSIAMRTLAFGRRYAG